jgi:hypothetical protein
MKTKVKKVVIEPPVIGLTRFTRVRITRIETSNLGRVGFWRDVVEYEPTKASLGRVLRAIEDKAEVNISIYGMDVEAWF